ncbi:glycosyltransferase [Lyngbya confervoides]|uniref:Glycosyltransferase n=1 Tax=Lyngbya confervoides BDU141951 TaxID=1574623 RepID=A0ABD4SZP2_9CYAN|nr:glycosyltransferase [Lyngbya confervoides]MCM1981595.1 glycosyltransferase [Lyngbya confervoides BDU141951]
MFEFKGGIQTFSRLLCEALADGLPQTPQHIFSLHDRCAPRQAPNQQYHCAGRVPRQARFLTYGAQLMGWGLWQRPQLILTTHLNLAVVARRLKQITGTPYWIVAHGFESWHISKPQVLDALTHADRVLAVSHFTRNQLIARYGLNPDQVSVFPNTFEASRFQIAPKPQHLLDRYGLQRDQPILLTVNRLAAGESFRPYDQVLKALPAIQAVIPNVHYLIVGNGDDRERLAAEIRQRQLEGAVTLTGFVPDEDLPDHYNLCDLYTMPSKLEGFGIVFLEALASGKPVLASASDGGQDAVCNGKLGILVDPEDVAAIAAQTIQILQKRCLHPLLYQPEALRQAVIGTYGKAQFRQNLLGELSQLAPQPDPGLAQWAS